MTRRMWLACVAALALAIPAQADEKKDTPAKNAAFEQLKKLVGDWVALDKDGKPTKEVVSAIKIIGAGSAVHETIFPGAAHEMVSVYHMDGKDLVMTHYCAAQNQPKMKLDPKSTATKLNFEFIGGANIDPAKDMHMHNGSIIIVDENTIEWTWCGWSNGKADEGHKVHMKLVRKK
jgi:hypothetical protein